jgi:ATP-dependent protease ClpP protease subunit
MVHKVLSILEGAASWQDLDARYPGHNFKVCTCNTQRILTCNVCAMVHKVLSILEGAASWQHLDARYPGNNFKVCTCNTQRILTCNVCAMVHKVLSILEGAASWCKLILIFAAIHAVTLQKITQMTHVI